MPTPARISAELTGLRAAVRAGMIGPLPPKALAAAVRALRAYGPLGAATALPAHRFPDRTALADDRGSLTFAELDRRCNGVANALRARGVGAGDTVGILCRNHRGFLEAMSGAARTGASVLFLNTDFAAPQLRDAMEREGVTALVHDDEFTALADGLEPPRFTESEVEEFGTGGDGTPPPAPARNGSMVILTSGTSGRPKGTPRAQPRSIALPGAILSKVPFRGGEAMFVAPPLFHGLGLTSALLALGLGSPLVLRRRFDAERVLDDLEEHHCTSLVAVPVMLHRIMAVPGLETRDLSRLKVIVTGGARLDAGLCGRVLAAFGPSLYNFYGSTEAACITIATPDELAAAPGCVGRPPAGTTVALLGEDGRPVPPGATGRIFVDSPARFSGYTGGGGKEEIGRLMAVGDLGHLDAGGLLHVDGRADDMIVSGGENVHPGEVEDLLAAHPGIEEAAVVGVPDEEFGQRLRAYVVARGLGEDDVKGHVSANLARHKVPREVVFLDALPRNPAGKVLKRALPGAAGLPPG
jgi:fatty-acyl-CoA synthase